ncbi:class I SAM-dependent methyltransferase [Halorubrum sp. DTA98]|uniref:class I SAM-dependent methyltransferase n=1 Tax=Halorubrum sp. DTA98 TaxID=3402163 RepID=UPI003AAE9B8C
MSALRAARHYTRYADSYDRIATDTPLVAGLRERIVDALDPGRGDVVVEMGCGTGSNLPYLRDRVGPEGTVIGLDVSSGVVARARDRIAAAGWGNVHVALADAAAPPVAFADLPRTIAPAGEVDAVLATFVTGMFDDPAAVVDDWCRIVAGRDETNADDGRVCVAGFARSTHTIGRCLNPAFAGLVRLGTPPGRGRGRPESPVELLDERALAAHERVHERCRDARTERALVGFARITAGTVDGR